MPRRATRNTVKFGRDIDTDLAKNSASIAIASWWVIEAATRGPLTSREVKQGKDTPMRGDERALLINWLCLYSRDQFEFIRGNNMWHPAVRRALILSMIGPLAE